ncbi:hypothetical protein ABS71_17675 [bacterium SCN 62-11]|nr:hypothetical protein [Candidatus Eremiobacteraeota bacterium]ODT59800.1 MAG: hypothetical protein ABS71_17675 [bacterium SCN 62-11]
MKISSTQFLRQASPLKGRAQQPASGSSLKAPADLVELRAAATQRGRVSLPTLAVLGTVAAVMTAAVLLTPGPSISVGDLGATLARQSPQQDRETSMRFEVLPNATGKIDVVRQQDSESDGNNGTRNVNRPHSPLGVYLGDGIFLDANQNLSFVPARLLQGPVMEPARSIEVSGTQSATVTQSGAETKIDRFLMDQTVRKLGADQVEFRAGSWGGPIQISRSGDTTTIQGGNFYKPVTITHTDSRVTVREGGLFGSSVDTIISRDGNRFEVARNSFFGPKVQGSINEAGQVSYQGTGIVDAVVQRADNGLVTTRNGFLSGNSTLDLRGNSLRETGPDGHFEYRITR